MHATSDKSTLNQEILYLLELELNKQKIITKDLAMKTF